VGRNIAGETYRVLRVGARRHRRSIEVPLSNGRPLDSYGAAP